MPDILFAHRNLSGVNFFSKKLTPPLRIHHHRADPMKTPKTSIPAEEYSLFTLPTPKPAKIAAKDRIVIGFVRVRKNADT
jgi:hypothetical protein